MIASPPTRAPTRRVAPGSTQAARADRTLRSRMLFAVMGDRVGAAIQRKLPDDWMLIPADADAMAWHWPVDGLEVWLRLPVDSISSTTERAIHALLRDGATSVQVYHHLRPAGVYLHPLRVGHAGVRAEMGA